MDQSESEFKYEVAFSFLSQDEVLATQLHDNLADRFKAFLYTKKQEEMAGTDGMESYSNVFLNESRLNVVLYREGWGNTRFTRIEMTAIQNRLFQTTHGGWDSLLVVKLDKSKLPTWIPPFYVYVDYDTYGLDKTIGIIEFKVQSLGGKIKKESLSDFAARQQRKLKLIDERKKYLESVDAVRDAQGQIQQIFGDVASKWENLKTNMPELKIGKIEKDRDSVVFNCGIYWLAFVWEHYVLNSIMDSHLFVKIYSMPRFTEHRYQEHETTRYKFSTNEIMECGWEDTENQFLRSDEVVDHWIRSVIELAHAAKKKGDDDAIISSW